MKKLTLVSQLILGCCWVIILIFSIKRKSYNMMNVSFAGLVAWIVSLGLIWLLLDK